MRAWLMVIACMATTALGGCGGGGGGGSTTSAAQPLVAVALNLSQPRVEIGKKIFEDPSLSASGKMSCASCHVLANGHADPTGTFLPLGGPNLDRQGLRSSPMLHYLYANREFRFENGEPFGGFTWDGRANSLAEQAAGPFFSDVEMANLDLADVMAKIRNATWFAEFLATYEVPAGASDETIFESVKTAIATYQLGETDYRLFNSKYDRVLDGNDQLTAAEARGLGLFNDPNKGNCAACHTSTPQANGDKPLFTNFGYYALGVPRAASVKNLSDPTFFDLGLCGPNRHDLAGRADLCGKFKTPSLRNIEVSGPYFHNAAIATLEDAVRFHVTRDTDAGRWYPMNGGVVKPYNDLPEQYHGNVVRIAPFNRSAGDAPALSEAEIGDVVAFLRTLTDVIEDP